MSSVYVFLTVFSGSRAQTCHDLTDDKGLLRKHGLSLRAKEKKRETTDFNSEVVTGNSYPWLV